jgi:hypothetical protein
VSDVSGRGALSAVRDAARALNGSIQVLSKPNAGTTSRFEFPTAEANKESFGSRYPGARPGLAPPPTPAPEVGSDLYRLNRCQFACLSFPSGSVRRNADDDSTR